MKRFSAILLLCALLLSTAACGATEQETTPAVTDTQETTADTASNTEQETDPALSDDLPAMNYDGRAYRIASVEGYTDEFFTE